MSELSMRELSPSQRAISRFLGHPEQRRSELAGSHASTWLSPTPGLDGHDAGAHSRCHDRDESAFFGYENVYRKEADRNMFVPDVGQPRAR